MIKRFIGVGLGVMGWGTRVGCAGWDVSELWARGWRQCGWVGGWVELIYMAVLRDGSSLQYVGE
jgi:hypothetical protein